MTCHIFYRLVIWQYYDSYLNAGLYMAFKHCLSFPTNLAAKLDCNRFRIISKIISKLQAFMHSKRKWLCCLIGIWSEDLLLDSLATTIWRRFESATFKLHRIRFATCRFVPLPYFDLKPMSDNNLTRLIEAMSAALVCNKFLRNPLIFHFQREKVCCHCTKCVKQ